MEALYWAVSQPSGCEETQRLPFINIDAKRKFAWLKIEIVVVVVSVAIAVIDTNSQPTHSLTDFQTLIE